MNMDTTTAMEYLKKNREPEASQPSVPGTTEGDAPTVAEDAEENKTTEPDNEAEAGREPAEPEVPVEKAGEEPQPQQKKPSRQERVNHAFQRNKQKFKAELEAKDKRIAELEEKVKKYSVLEQGDFDPNDVKSYIDHKIALEKEQGELERLKADRTRMVEDDRMADASERHARQVEECFESDDEREHYWALLRNGGQKFREFLNEYDDGTIDAFIGDSDMAPVLISTLMRNPDVLKSIVEKRNPMRKMIALQQLETRLGISRKVARTKAPEPEPQKPTARLPITGSQVQNPGSSASTQVKDWNRYLAEHPRTGY